MDNEKQEYNSFYRGFVVDNRDPNKKGRVLVWIPDVMPNIPQDQGLWAKPANNPLGGRNNEYVDEHHYMGSCYIPKKGSYVWIFFECGNINRPYYFGSLEPGNTEVLPECQVGGEYEHKWVVFKSHEGRCIVISDDPDDRRVEITGKKRNLNNPPTGDEDSVYEIDGNQTTILFDEREGKEKILIRSHKGDYLHIDVDEQKLQAYFKEDIRIKTDAKLSIQADEMHIKSNGGDINIDASGTLNNKGGSGVNVDGGGDVNILAGGNLNTDGAFHSSQEGSAIPADSANPDNPEGDRDT